MNFAGFLWRSAVIAVLCLDGTSSFAANTFYVSPSGHNTNPGTLAAPFLTISYALGAVDPGDTLMLTDGTFSGPGDTDVTVSIPITITSVNGSGRTVIDGGGTNWAFALTAGSTATPMVLKGLTIQNCTSGPSSSGAVSLVSSSTQISACRFVNNEPTSAISVDAGSTCVVTASEFAYNVGANGGAIDALGTVNVNNSFFDGNMAAEGGAMYIAGPSSTLFEATFFENQGTTQGGAIMSFTQALNVFGCSFTGNEGETSGGAIANFGAVTISMSSFFGNSTPGYGGAIFNNHTHILKVQNDIIAQNSATYGGAISNDGDTTVSYSTITQNTAIYGGGEYNKQPTNSLTNDIIWGNQVTPPNNVYTTNGGYDVLDISTSTAKNCDFGSNAVPQTGGLSANPQFVDPAGGDYSLQATSPCRQAGSVITGLTSDYKGRPRSASTPTIGAIEGGTGGEFQFVSSVSGSDGVERDLWQGLSDDAGYFVLWRVIPPANPTTSHKFGPFNYGKPLFIGVGPNLHERVLFSDPLTWKLTFLDIAPNLSYTSLVLGPFTNSSPTSMSVGSDNHIHAVLTNVSGTIAYYNISTNGTYTTKSYGPY